MGRSAVSVKEAVVLCLLLTALDRLQLSSAEGCCPLVPANSPECLSQCEEHGTSNVFALLMACGTLPQSGSFWACINGVSGPHPGVQCCNKTLNTPCWEACTELLTRQDHVEADQVFGALSGVCNNSQHIAVHPVVECIVEKYNIPLSTIPHFPNLTKSGVDFARLHCCTKAVSAQCREDCFQYHASPSTSLYEKFNDDCRYHPDEYALYSCFEDVYAPSKPGCNDLQFCHMFNNRPAEFFRYCWAAEDNVASGLWDDWLMKRRMDHAYLPISIPLKDISQCHSEQWKTLACLLHIRPTDDDFHTTTVCREDCEQLMTACVDMDGLRQLRMTIQDICSRMAPSNSQKHCVRLSQFTDAPQTAVDEYSPVQQPCNENPCSEGEACLVNSECTDGGECLSYICVPGCHVGQQEGLNSIIVPRHQLQKVVVPLLPYNTTRTLCHTFHTCSSTNLHLTAMELTSANFHCKQQVSCTMDAVEYAHGSVIVSECNICSCQNGLVLCTKWNCRLPDVIVIDDCSSVGVSPVCTPMGQTLRHPCHARERWLESELADGACSVQDGCTRHRCPTGTRCIPIHSACVAASSGVCQKHICAQIAFSSDECTTAVSTQGVCDTSNQYFNNLCSLLTSRRVFSYWGACKSECAVSNPVCGVDGNTYATPCHAQGVNMAVDYDGPCVLTCDGVQCAPLPNEHCSAFTPPGSCCPKCGGLVTLVVDSLQLQNSLLKMGLQQVTVRDIAARLEEKLNTLRCRVYAYLSQESSNAMYVLVTPTASSTSMNQINACKAEAQAVVARVNTQVVYYSMDSLLAHVVAAKHSSDLRIVIANVSELEANSHSVAVMPFAVCVLLCAASAIAAHFSDITF